MVVNMNGTEKKIVFNSKNSLELLIVENKQRKVELAHVMVLNTPIDPVNFLTMELKVQ